MSYQRTKTKENVVTIPKGEFLRLKQQARAYRSLATKIFTFPLRDSIDVVVDDFRTTKRYTDAFLKDLEEGLRESSYVKHYGHKAATRRS